MRHTRIYALDRAEWRRNVPFYRDEASSPFQARFIKEKRSVYGLGESHRHVLDLGAGVGEFASLLMDEGRAVIAVDFVLEMALAAREKRPRLRYVVASADRLPSRAIASMRSSPTGPPSHQGPGDPGRRDIGSSPSPAPGRPAVRL